MIKRYRNPGAENFKFSEVPHANIPRSVFRRSNNHKTAFDAANLVPIWVDEALPGDTFNMKMAAVCRLATPLVPFMDNLYIDYFFFAVPNRIIWTNWKKMMGEQVDPGDSIDYTVPIMTAHAPATASLSDYMGLPVGGGNVTANSLHFRAYNLIYNEWFRDQNLQDSVVVDTDDGPDAIADYVLLKRNKRHNYFTSALPWAQKGTAVDLPLGTSAPITNNGKAMGLFDGTNALGLYDNGASGLHGATGYQNGNIGTGYAAGTGAASNVAIGLADASSAQTGLIADLSSATAATINSLREAFQLQRMMERDARSGTRYTEVIKAHFRVDSPDSRMQRPEYLGGGSGPVTITPVPQTSESGTTKQGTLAAVGYHATGGIGFSKSFTEHCVLIGLACVRADLNVSQRGLDRMWSRQTRYDFYWPALAHLGEQEVLNKEIWHNSDAADDTAWGYQERWAEYRYKNNRISGILRSDAASALDEWHLAIDYAARPALNDAFMQESPPISRVVSVPSEPEIIGDFFFNCITARPMPTYSVPGLIDHF